MQGHPYADWIGCEDEKTARAIEDYFLKTGHQGDKGGGSPDHPPTRVYAFRAPRLTSFREWLRSHEEKEGEEGKRRARREEWVAAADRLIGRCQAWLAEADPEGILNLHLMPQGKAEAGLGRYEIPVLVIYLEDKRVQIVPFARNTTRVLSFAPHKQFQTEGRVDITNGMEKFTLYRVHVEGKEHWYAVPERGDPVELNQDTFMAIMEDLLS
jgi:hypothetical protein